MKQEDKDLLLKDLCARLPYGIKVNVKGNIEFINTLRSIDIDGYCEINDNLYKIDNIKPYLYPLSSMTDEQEKEFEENFVTYHPYITGGWCCVKYASTHFIPIEIIDWLNTNHFDYRDLIKKGLAIDATNLNIY